MRVIRTRTYFMAVLAIAALINSTSGVFATTPCWWCGFSYYHCTKNCASAYPTPPASWQCMATCEKHRQSCNAYCACPPGTGKICGGFLGGVWTCDCVSFPQ